MTYVVCRYKGVNVTVKDGTTGEFKLIRVTECAKSKAIC